MVELSNFWAMIAPYVTNGAVVGAIVSVLGALLSRKIKKTKDTTTTAIENVKKSVNNEVIAEKVTENMKEYFKNVTIEQDLTPLAKSTLKTVTEEANDYLKQQLKETQEGYNKLLNCIEKLSAYFDNSIGVSEDAKAELKKAIEEAKVPEEPKKTFETKIVAEEVKVEEVKIEEPKKQTKKKTAEIER